MVFKVLIKKVSLILFTLIFLFMVFPSINVAKAGVEIDDDNLANALITIAGVNSKSELTPQILSNIIGPIDLSGRDITKLKGIEYLVNISSLDISDNPIYQQSEVARIAKLTKLTALDISSLSISELPSQISTMTWLKELDISANRFVDLPSHLDNLNLDVIRCNYCYLDVSNESVTKSLILASAKTHYYMYQLKKVTNFVATCAEDGIIVLTWDVMPDISFDNGASAQVMRYSISDASQKVERGEWIDSTRREDTTYTFQGLNPKIEYSFDISVDYYIRNTKYDGKYIKNYVKTRQIPVAQIIITPTELTTPTASPYVTPTATILPSQTTQAIKPTATLVPKGILPTDKTSGDKNPLSTLVTFIVVLVLLIIVLGIVLLLRINKPNKSKDNTTTRRN